MLQIVDLEDDVKIIKVLGARKHLQLINVAVQLAYRLRHLSKGADLVVDFHGYPRGIAKSFITRIPGQIDPAVRLVVESLQGPGENGIDSDTLSLGQNAHDPVTRHRTGFGGDPNWKVAVDAADRNRRAASTALLRPLANLGRLCRFWPFLLQLETHGAQYIRSCHFAP